jgi:hypothetical protein
VDTRLTDAEALAAVHSHGNVTAASRALNIPRTTLVNRIQRIKAGTPATASRQSEPVLLPRGLTEECIQTSVIPVGALRYEDEWRVWLKHVGALSDRYPGPQKRIARTGRLKIVVLSDLHAPFHDVARIAEICEREKDADIALILGDLGDGYSLSRFTKYENVPYEQELAAITQLLETFSATWPLIKLIEGNHDSSRLERKLRNELPPDFVTAILAMTGGTLSPLVALTRRFANVELCGWTAPDGSRLKWMTQIGDALFTHAEVFSKTPSAALRVIESWLRGMEKVLDLDSWRLVIQAHTHQLSWFPFAADKLLVECGCMCRIPGYAYDPKLGGLPQRQGYVTLEQVDGKTDINSVRLHWLDA